MRTRTLFAPLVTAAMAAAAVLGTASAVQAAEPDVKAVTLTYDTSQAAEFVQDVHDGAQVWNDNVENVQLEPVADGQTADFEVVATDGWPQAWVPELGKGTIEFGRQAVNEGHNTTRIASHEIGHILGLPDMKPGPCESLMSGASAGTDCDNAIPNA
ncbi:MAG: snapalysin family zinc-dependent metalloprotease, partial [Stackebrandtia sp.]